MRGALFVATIGLTLAGCAPAEQNATELSRLQYTTHCDSQLPFFGYYRYSRDELTQFVSPDGRISMVNDGMWCAIHYRTLTPSGGYTVSEAMIAQPPGHGSAMVGTVDGVLRIAYRPNQLFVGNDNFEVRLLGPFPYAIPVRVSVRPVRASAS